MFAHNKSGRNFLEYYNRNLEDWLANYRGKIIYIHAGEFVYHKIFTKRNGLEHKRKNNIGLKVTDAIDSYISIPTKLNPKYWILKHQIKNQILNRRL